MPHDPTDNDFRYLQDNKLRVLRGVQDQRWQYRLDVGHLLAVIDECAETLEPGDAAIVEEIRKRHGPAITKPDDRPAESTGYPVYEATDPEPQVPKCLGCKVRDDDLYALMQRFNAILGRETEQVRVDQDEEWGGPDHDDKHPIREWPKYIAKQNLLAARSAMDSENRTGEGFALETEMFESRMLKIVGLAVSGVLSSRRKRNA